MMRTLLVMLAAMLAMTGSAAGAVQAKRPACSITYRASDAMTQQIQHDGFGFDGFDALCRALERDGMAIDIKDDQGVMLERAYGWALIRLVRTATGAYSSRSQSNTVMSRTASTPEAALLTMAAVNNALAGIARDPDLFIRSVKAAEPVRPGG